MGSEKIQSLSDDEFEDAEELEEVDELDEDLEEDNEREDSALEDLKAVQAAISSDDEDDDEDLGGLSLGFGAQAAASLGGGASLAGGDPSPSLSAGPSPSASLSPAASLVVDDGDDAPDAAASLASKSTIPASLAAAPAAAAAAPPPEKNNTNWGIVAAIVAVALATVGAVAFVAINPRASSTADAEEDVGVGRAALAGGAMAAGAANPTANLQKAARPLGAAPEAEPMAEATKVAEDAEAAALEKLDAEGLILDEDDGEFEEGDPMHGGAKLQRKKRKKVDIEYGLKRNKRDSGEDETSEEPTEEPAEAAEPEAKAEPETEEPRVAKNEENIDCLLNPGAPGCKKYDMPKAETQKEQLPQKLSQRDIAMGLRAPKKSAKQCGQTHNSSEVVRVHVTISGDGTVKQVTAKGLHKGTPLGTCVEGFLSKATFPQFQNPTMGLDISVAM